MKSQTPAPKMSKLTEALNVDFSNTHEPWLTSQRTLRRLIGVSGMLLPLMLWLVVLADTAHPSPMDSISHYYFTRANSIFITVVSLLAVFLAIYKGMEPIDFYLSSLASLGAFLLVLFPTSNITKACDDEMLWSITFIRQGDYTTARVLFHYISAGVFLLCLALMSIFLFTKTNPQKKVTEQKKFRNVIYITCGVLMIAALLVIFVGGFLGAIPEDVYHNYQLTFWMETIAIESFGFSWLVKGETLFQDK